MYGYEETLPPPIHAGRLKAKSPIPLGGGSGRFAGGDTRSVQYGRPAESGTTKRDVRRLHLPVDDQTDPDTTDGSYDDFDFEDDFDSGIE